MESLPNEIFEEIFSYLTIIEYKTIKPHLISKALYTSLTNHFYYSIYNQSLLSLHFLLNGKENLPLNEKYDPKKNYKKRLGNVYNGYIRGTFNFETSAIDSYYEVEYGEGEAFFSKKNKTKKMKKYFYEISTEKNELFFFDSFKKEKQRYSFNLENCEIYDLSMKIKYNTLKIVCFPMSGYDKKEEFYLTFTHTYDMDKFIEILKDCSGKFLGENVGKENAITKTLKKIKQNRIENIHFSKWNKKESLKWLNMIKLSNEFKKMFIKNEINGKALETMNLETILKFGASETSAKKLVKEIETLKTNKFYNNFYKIVKKLNQIPKFVMNEKVLQEYVTYLTSFIHCRHSFFNNVNVLKSITSDEIKKKKVMDTLDFSRNHSSNKYVRVMLKESSKIDDFRDLYKKRSSFLPSKTKKKESLENISLQTCIFFDSWEISWNESGIVRIIRPDYKTFSLELCKEKIPSPGENETFAPIYNIAELVTKYNIEYSFKKIPEKPNEKNCQNFVDDILKALNVKLMDDQKIALNLFKEKGEICELQVVFSKYFKEYFDMKESGITFKTHAELDVFVNNLKSKADLYNQFPCEYGFLKSFDRLFWERHLTFPEKKEFQCMDNSKEYTGCPFGDPRDEIAFKL